MVQATRGIVRDLDIRRALLLKMKQLHYKEPDTRVVEELGLCQGNARVDIAVVNGSLHGYEIKSERDTLNRLPSQCETYNRSLDFVTIVASSAHLEKIRKLVPGWWGIWTAQARGSRLQLQVERAGQRNPTVIPLAMAQLLWREEALQVLEEAGAAEGLRNKTRNQIWQRLTEALTTNQLGDAVRSKLKARQHWRADVPPALCGD
jgi:hypothetical protein